MTDNIIEIEDLKAHFVTNSGLIKAVDGISLVIPKGKTLALVGESGSGKSVTAFSIMRLIPCQTARIFSGRILFRNIDLLKIPECDMLNIRGNEISMIFQEPMSSLNPVMTVGEQIREVVRRHKGVSKRQATDMVVQLLKKLGITSPEVLINGYPHQMSGGMRQRIMIAMSIICTPQLLIADEPTTGLDLTIQSQILDLIKRLKISFKMSIMFITHDLAIVADIADFVAVMYKGKIVEYSDVKGFFNETSHPYSLEILKALPMLKNNNKNRIYWHKNCIFNTIKNKISGKTFTDSCCTHYSFFDETDFVQNINGCRFSQRCCYTSERCKALEPELYNISNDHKVACWIYN